MAIRDRIVLKLSIVIAYFLFTNLGASAQQSVCLQDGWEFLKQDLGGPWEAVRPVTKKGDPGAVPLWQPVKLPHCVNARDAVDPDGNYYRGPAWYRTQLEPHNPYPGGRTLLHFEGAGQKTAVYIYTTQVGAHTGGYDEWTVDITDAAAAFAQTGVCRQQFKGKIPLSVRTDNSRDFEMIPSGMSDFNLYGGIYRRLSLVYVPAVYIDQLLVNTSVDSLGRAGKVGVRLLLNKPSVAAISFRLQDPSGHLVTEMTGAKATAASDTLALPDIVVKAPHLWRPDDPALYTLTVMAGDSCVQKKHIGFRHFTFIDHGPFLLNGHRLLLRGTHRHEDHAGVGAAMTGDQMRQEMVMIKEMGVNFIRLGHYQQSPLILDLCDSLGILVWEEIPWCRGGLGGTVYQEQARRMLTHMIGQHLSHPAVIIWGLGNENDWPGDFPEFDKEKIRGFMKELNDLAHRLDPSRRTAIRRCDFCRDIPDIYSPSIWMGWYRGVFTDYRKTTEEEFKKVHHFLHVEWGGDSHAGRHTEDPVKMDWSENYICDLIDWHLKEQDSMPWLTGTAAWCFKDFSTPLRPDNPVPYVNQKGVVERDLTKKEAYYVFQSYWSDKPMVHIYGHTWSVRWGAEGQLRRVKVYSNCEEATLYLNGRSCGVRHRNSRDYPAAGLRWDLPFQKGENSLRVVARKAGVVVEDTVHFQYLTEKWGKPARVKIEKTAEEKDIVTVRVRLLDDHGIPCPDATDWVSFGLAGDGRLIDDQGTSTGSRYVQCGNGQAMIRLHMNGGHSVVSAKVGKLPAVFLDLPSSPPKETGTADDCLKLWYDKPARVWEEALPLGNGKTGAMVFGRSLDELYQLNDNTLWSGAPEPGNNPNGPSILPKVREAVFKGDYDSAAALWKKMQGPYSARFLPLADLRLDMSNHTGDTNILQYYRDLDLNTATTHVRYTQSGITFRRTSFISYPGKVMVIHLTASKKHALDFSVGLGSQLRYRVAVAQGAGHAAGPAGLTDPAGPTLILTGKAPKFVANRDYEPQQIVYDGPDGEGMNFQVEVKVKTTGGSVTGAVDHLKITGADEATIYLTEATSYNGFDRSPGHEGKDPSVEAGANMRKAWAASYDALLKDHLGDYQRLFRRVSLDLGVDTAAVRLPTDLRIRRFDSTGNDHQLQTLYYQYGRYLLIACSRPGSLPANLQGIWNRLVQPPWGSNYTTNINTEMNYWLAENTNLSECHQPLFDFIKALAVNGAQTARINYGIREGWVTHHNSDAWAKTSPPGGYDWDPKGMPRWSCWPMAGAWLCTHLWEHFLFTSDTLFLRKAYPLMKGAAQFMQHWLIKDPVSGLLVTNPSTSPENTIKINGKEYQLTMASTMDMSIIRELFADVIRAGQLLRTDAAYGRELAAMKSQLYPFHIGQYGQLQEWFKDWDDPNDKHRHASHLFSLYPGSQITPDSTPDLAAAARQSLILRGDVSTGWSMAWKVNWWARLKDGNHAYKILRDAFNFIDPTIEKAQMSGGGVYPNLFDAHPPFQIDGNFGATAGMTEMLLQSHNGIIRLLPALPDAWAHGVVKGLKARGNFTVGIEWERGRLTRAVIVSGSGGMCRISTAVPVKVEGVKVHRAGGNTIEFNTLKGAAYVILPEQAPFYGEMIKTLKKQSLEEAAWALQQAPITVTADHCPRSAGGLHDFYSEGDYWWPDPKHPDSPYIQRDGMTNPANFTAHRLAMIRLSRIIGALATAYKITGDAKYIGPALRHCSAWFVDTATCMNPDLQYAQAIKGRVTGRGIGIIDTIQLMEVVEGLEAMEGDAAMDKTLLARIREWFTRYLQWLTTHPYGKDEMNAANNHGTCWVMQVAAFARFTGDTSLMGFCSRRYKEVLLPGQMDTDGSFPRELKRTKPYGYSLFNLDAMTTICQLLSTPKDDLWHYQTADGRGIEKGIAFMAPLIADKGKWPYAHDVMYWDQWPVAQPALVFGANALRREDWFCTWQRLDHAPANGEVIRNLPVRHPIIWINY